jgi:hypothetical protein
VQLVEFDGTRAVLVEAQEELTHLLQIVRVAQMLERAVELDSRHPAVRVRVERLEQINDSHAIHCEHLHELVGHADAIARTQPEV